MIYIFVNPDDENEYVEVMQGANDTYEITLDNGSKMQVHKYFDETGKEWRRVFTVPNIANGCSRIDPFSKKSFTEKTKGVKTYGEMWDISKEMSDKRAEKIGNADPVKEKAKKEFYNPKKKNI